MKEFVKDGYIICIGDGEGGQEISQSRYNAILEAMSNRPQATDSEVYRLKTDLTWEACEVIPVPEPEPEIDDSEAVEILLGGAS